MGNADLLGRLGGLAVRSVRSGAPVLILALLQTGCASTGLILEEVVRPDPTQPKSYLSATAAEVRTGVSVIRHGQSIPVEVPMDLQVGDEIKVRAPAIATISFPEGHEVTLMPNTHVRLGSIFQYFGELFIRARGYFKVETEYWTAGVKGTEFSVRLSPDQKASVAVAEGSISLTSKTANWPETEISQNEVATMQRDGPPSKALKEKIELDAIRQLLHRSRTRLPNIPARR